MALEKIKRIAMLSPDSFAAMARTPQPASQAAPLTGDLSSCNNTNYANISPAQGDVAKRQRGFPKKNSSIEHILFSPVLEYRLSEKGLLHKSEKYYIILFGGFVSKMKLKLNWRKDEKGNFDFTYYQHYTLRL